MAQGKKKESREEKMRRTSVKRPIHKDKDRGKTKDASHGEPVQKPRSFVGLGRKKKFEIVEKISNKKVPRH